MLCRRLQNPGAKLLLSSFRTATRNGSSLSYTKHGERKTQHAPVLFLHGVFGSKINFNKPARRIAADLGTEAYCLDCRNHGASPWYDTMYLPELADDVVTFAREQGIDKFNIVGHSLGGKQACLVCAHHPALVQSAVIVDMFPVTFSAGLLDETCTALLLLDIDKLTTRKQAFELLANQIQSESERNFILSNLLQVKGGGWRWRCNLDIISRFTEEIRGFPDNVPESSIKSLFVYGGASDYMTPERVTRTRELFSDPHFQEIEGAGHIVHLDKPEEFYAVMRNFLEVNGKL